MAIPRYEDWIEETKLGVMHPRRSTLRAVDNALQTYWQCRNDPNKRGKAISDIRIGLMEWTKDRGSDCRTSPRNKPPRYIVTELLKAVNEQPIFSAEELEAFRWQEEQRRLRVRAIFRDKRIAWRAVDTKSAVKAAHVDLMRIRGMDSLGQSHTPDAAAIARALAEQQNRDRWVNRLAPGRVAGGQNILAAGGAGADISRLVRGGLPTGTEANQFGLQGIARLGGDAAMSQTHDAFHEMMSGIFAGQSLSSVGADLARGIGMDMHQLASDVIPIVSNITSGAKLLVAWGRAAWAAWRESTTLDHGRFLSGTEDIQAAFTALATMLDRRTTAMTLEAGIQSADFATRTAMSFVDLGAASSAVMGVVTSLSKLVHKLYLFARELAEKRKADLMLSDPDKLGFEMFQTYPLVGCYMLCCSDLSELIILSRAQGLQGGVPFGAQGWMYDVEYLKREHIDPILKRAVAFVNASPFYIPGMAMHVKYQPDVFDRLGWYAGKAGAAGNIFSIGRAAV
jgi:hypothetical protein